MCFFLFSRKEWVLRVQIYNLVKVSEEHVLKHVGCLIEKGVGFWQNIKIVVISYLKSSRK